MWNWLWIYGSYRVGRSIGNKGGTLALLIVVGFFLTLIFWEDIFQPFFTSIGVTDAFRRVNLVRDDKFETLIMIVVVLPIALMLIAVALIITLFVLIMIGSLLGKIFSYLNRYKVTYWCKQFFIFVLTFPYSVFKPLYLKLFYKDRWNKYKYFKKHNYLARYDKNKSAWAYFEKYNVLEPSLAVSKQQLLNEINRLMFRKQEYFEVFLTLAEVDKQEKLYFVSYTPDFSKEVNGKVLSDKYVWAYPIEFGHFSNEESIKLQKERVQIPLKNIKKVRKVYHLEGKIKELYDQLLNNRHDLSIIEKHWKADTEKYIVQKKYLLTLIEKNIIPKHMEDYIYQKLSHMKAIDDDLALILPTQDEYFRLLLRYTISGDIKPVPFRYFDQIKDIDAVKNFAFTSADDETAMTMQDLINYLSSKGYNVEEIFGDWLTWAA